MDWFNKFLVTKLYIADSIYLCKCRKCQNLTAGFIFVQLATSFLFTVCQHDKQSSFEIKFTSNRGRIGGEKHISILVHMLCQKHHPSGKRDSENLHLDYCGNRKTMVMNLVLKKRLMWLYFE